jgi:hypothetical protein
MMGILEYLKGVSLRGAMMRRPMKAARRHGTKNLALVAVCLISACGQSSLDTVAGTETDTGTTMTDDAQASQIELDIAEEHTRCPLPPAGPGQVRARHLQCPNEIQAGLLVAALEDDIVLENQYVQFVIRNRSVGHALTGSTGGHLVDAIAIDEHGVMTGQDALRELVFAVDFHLLEPSSVVIEADGSDGVARVVVEGELVVFPLLQGFLPLPKPDVQVRHIYELLADESVLRLRTHVTPLNAGQTPSVLMADIGLWGGDVAPFLPGIGAGNIPVSMEAMTMGLMPTPPAQVACPYALARPVSGSIITASAIMAFLWPDTTITEEGVDFTRILAVGGLATDTQGRYGGLAGAMAMATAEFGQTTLRLQGTVETATLPPWVEVRNGASEPLTRCPLTSDYVFDCQVPLESDSVVALWENGGQASTPHFLGPVGDAGMGWKDIELEVGARAELNLSVTDQNGSPLAFRLTSQREIAGETEKEVHVSTESNATFPVLEGEIEIWVHHGPEYSEYHEVFAVEAGEIRILDLTLFQVVDTEGWVACDFHVHAEQSTDSDVPTGRRLQGAIAEGLDYMVITDHDFITDPTRWLAAFGLEESLTVASGVEVSTTTLGHFNLWPLTRDPEQSGQGAPTWYDLDSLGLLDKLRQQVGDGVIQCNHPRFESAAYFDVIGFEDVAPNPELLAFDVMELLNGIGHSDTSAVMADWMSLLNQGIRRTATGTSDCHGTHDFVGNPRTLVYLGMDDDGNGRDTQGRFSATEVDEALKQGAAIATAGPVLQLTLTDEEGREASIGEVLTNPSGVLTAHIRLEAPAWMPLGRLQLWSHEDVVFEEDLSAESAPSNTAAVHEYSLSLGPFSDGWLAAVHEPGLKGKPGIHRPPWAITNPVFVDLDGDGNWVPQPE